MALVVDDALRLSAAEQRHVLAVITIGTNRVRHGVIDADRLQMAPVLVHVEVVRTMTGCGVHEARARVLGHVLAFEQRHLEIEAAFMQRVRSNQTSRMGIL